MCSVVMNFESFSEPFQTLNNIGTIFGCITISNFSTGSHHFFWWSLCSKGNYCYHTRDKRHITISSQNIFLWSINVLTRYGYCSQYKKMSIENVNKLYLGSV